MAKQKRSVKQTNVRGKSGQGQQLEHTEVFDDNLLPDATEIQKLHEIDPSIVNWLKERAEKEQEFRHEVFNKQEKLVGKSEKGIRTINFMGITFAFIFLCLGLCFSAYLIEKGHSVTGTIFSGTILISGAILLLGKKLSAKEKDK